MNLLNEYVELESFLRLYRPAADYSGIIFKPGALHFSDKLTDSMLGIDVLFIELEFAGKRTRITGVDPIELLAEAKHWFDMQILEIEKLAR